MDAMLVGIGECSFRAGKLPFPWDMSASIACCFVVLYDQSSSDELAVTLQSIGKFVGAQPRHSDFSFFSLVVVVSDAHGKEIPAVPLRSAFQEVMVLNRRLWDLPGEADFGGSPVTFNLANIALKRTMGEVMMIACGAKISDANLAAQALLRTRKHSDSAIISTAALKSGSGLQAKAIVFNKHPSWSNLASAMSGVRVTITKSLLGGFKIRPSETRHGRDLSDADVIAAIAFDYQRKSRHGDGEELSFSQFAI